MNRTEAQSKIQIFSYATYMAFVENLVQKRQTSGPLQTESLVQYTRLNLKRMQRLNKTVKVDAQLIIAVKGLPFRTKWTCITEAWCGDAAQNIPYIAALAASVPDVEFELVLRDENPELMDQYLTNGARSIPKLIIKHHETNQTLATWGSRPAEMLYLVQKYKNQVGEKLPFEVFAERIHAWYTSNKNQALSNELLTTFKSLQTIAFASQS